MPYKKIQKKKNEREKTKTKRSRDAFIIIVKKKKKREREREGRKWSVTSLYSACIVMLGAGLFLASASVMLAVETIKAIRVPQNCAPWLCVIGRLSVPALAFPRSPH